MLKICLKKILQLKKVKNTVPRINILDNLNGQETVGTLYEKRLQKQIGV